MKGSRGPRRRRRRSLTGRSWWQRLLALISLTLLGALAAAAGAWLWTRSGGPPGKPVELHIEAQFRLDELCAQLERARLVRSARLFGWYLRFTRAERQIQPGPHLVKPGLAPAALLARLTRSRARPVMKLTIPEGYNHFQIGERLREREIAPSAAFLNASRDPQLLAELGIRAASAEGYLFPATYEFRANSDPASVVRVLARETFRRFRVLAERHSEELREREGRLGWGMHELITLASIVEKEAGSREEHGTIASVFYNRLLDESFRPRRMLQSDPTAGYGCLLAGERVETCRRYTGIVTPSMLRDASNEYNTYKHPGLPPGPIANPSQSALEAVIAPPDTPYFFFVLGPAKRHVFSRTLSEHERAIHAASGQAGALP